MAIREAIYTNISSASVNTLITKGASVSGNIGKITISNHDNTDLTIAKVYLCSTCDGSDNYVIAETTIPPLATLVLTDNVSFNSGSYNLKIDSSTTAELTVIIK
tara:strand:+ start:312 stop:623 length:312 start_codon:yes stop_codon:yes gene_type:complete